MPFNGSFFRAWLLTAALPLAALLGAHAARASDPVPGDAIAPPPDVNIGLYYNIFSDASELGAVRGGSYDHSTHISTDVSVLRYIRTFSAGGMLAGVQIYEPYVTFLGTQEAGVANLGAAAPGLPSYGAGSADLSHQSGFGQPNIGAFIFPINNQDTGTYLVLGPWIAPPVSGYNQNYSLNPGNNTWTYEMEAGFRKMLAGTPDTQNLNVELWGESYFFSDNTNSAYVSPAVSANAIPPEYALVHALDPLVPDSNPIQAQSSTPATFHEQPSEEFRVYLPYDVVPAMHAYIIPGYYQSFGGKQTYTLRNGLKVDSGNRTEESQLRLFLQSFVSPTAQITLAFEYDVANHGGPLNRVLEFRFAKFF